jgi:hypothetical protein
VRTSEIETLIDLVLVYLRDRAQRTSEGVQPHAVQTNQPWLIDGSGTSVHPIDCPTVPRGTGQLRITPMLISNI